MTKKDLKPVLNGIGAILDLLSWIVVIYGIILLTLDAFSGTNFLTVKQAIVVVLAFIMRRFADLPCNDVFQPICGTEHVSYEKAKAILLDQPKES